MDTDNENQSTVACRIFKINDGIAAMSQINALLETSVPALESSIVTYTYDNGLQRIPIGTCAE